MLQNREEMFPRYYGNSDVIDKIEYLITGVLPIAKRLTIKNVIYFAHITKANTSEFVSVHLSNISELQRLTVGIDIINSRTLIVDIM